MKLAVIKCPEHESILVDSVNTFFEWENYLDLIFVCENNVRVRCHKIVLASLSQFIKDLIMTSNLNCHDPTYISLPGVSHKSVKMLLNFLYEGTMKVNNEQLSEMRNILTLLGIHLPPSLDSTMNDMSSATDKTGDAGKVLKVENVRSLNAVINFIDDPLNTPDFYFNESAANMNSSVGPGEEMSSRISTSTPVQRAASSKFPNILPIKNSEEPTEHTQTTEPEHETQEEVDDSMNIKEEVMVADVEDDMTMDETYTNEMDDESSNEYEDTRASDDTYYPSVCDTTEDKDEDVRSIESVPIHNSPVPSTSKKRFVFTDWHITYLEEAYIKEKFPDQTLQERLAEESSIPISVLRNWFTHRRAKDRKTPDLVDDIPTQKLPVCGKPDLSITVGSTPVPAVLVRKPSTATISTLSVFGPKISHRTPVPTGSTQKILTHKDYFNVLKLSHRSDNLSCQDDAVDLSQHSFSNSEYVNTSEYYFKEDIDHQFDDEGGDVKHDISGDQDFEGAHFMLGRHRKLTKRQVNRLEKEYRKCKYLDGETLDRLSNEMKINKNRLRKWFQKKRVKSGNTLKRNKFSDEQLSYLHEQYKVNKNPTGEVLDELTNRLDLPRIRIQNWFANKRLKEGITLRRRKYTDEQVNRMEEEYLKNKHPDIEILEQLANELEVPKVCLQNWFSNKRMKEGISLVRRQFTEQQLNTLEEEYKKNKNPSNEVVEKLAADLSIAEVHLQDWFSYKRMVEGNYMKRSKFNEHQLGCLEDEYRKNKYPDIDYLEQLAEELDIPKVRIQGWFSNKRMKEGNFKWKNLSEEQQRCLEKEYKKNKNPTMDTVEQLADELSIPEIHLQDWFAYKRMMEGISLKHSKFNEQQLNSLEEEYRKNKYPNVELLDELSKNLGLTKERLQKWFINKRKKEGVSLKWRNFTEQQLNRLDEEYRKNKDPNMDQLSSELGIPKIHLRDWFAYKRKMEETSFKRSSFTEQELRYLEREYSKNKHPNMDHLSMELGIPKIRLQNWFSNKRTREGTAMKRIRFSDDQLRCLEDEYRRNKHPSIHIVDHLAVKLGIQKIRIQAWFAKKRTKDGICTQRNRFSEQQLSCLWKEYRKNKRPNGELIEQLADELKVPKIRLQTWFSKQRMKEGLNRRKYFKSVI